MKVGVGFTSWWGKSYRKSESMRDNSPRESRCKFEHECNDLRENWVDFSWNSKMNPLAFG